MQTNRSPTIKRQSTSLAAFNLPRRKCTHCGKTNDRKVKCPAQDAICHRCNRKGHYESQCFSKTVSAVALEDSLTEESLDEDKEHVQSKRYLDCITSTQPKTWTATIIVGGKPALFKLDTGAEVTAVSDQFYQECSAPLQKPSQAQVAIRSKYWDNSQKPFNTRTNHLCKHFCCQRSENQSIRPSRHYSTEASCKD